jgi:hypothetical protein
MAARYTRAAGACYASGADLTGRQLIGLLPT